MSDTVPTAVPYSTAELNANQLKLLAILAMTFDHCMFLYPQWAANPALRIPGRLAAPIMCFFIAEGFAHTSNLRRYMGRLFLFALLSHVPYCLYFGYAPFQGAPYTSVLWSLLLGLVALTALKQESWPIPARLISLPVFCLLAYTADWNYIAVLLVLVFGVFREDPVKRSIAHGAVGVLYVLQAMAYHLNPLPRLGIFLSIPVLLLYNGSLGRKSKALQHAFYWYYPVHLLLLYLLHQFL